MVAWREYLRALGVILVGVALGALWVMVQWMGPDAQRSVLDTLPALLLGFLVLGALAQAWLSPGLTAALAVAFLAGQMAASDEYDFRSNVERDDFGEYPPIFFVVIITVGVAVGTSLFGHWLTSVVRARGRLRPKPSQRP